MSVIEQAPMPGEQVHVFSPTAGTWITATVEGVEGEQATVFYTLPTATGDPDLLASRQVVDWDDPEQTLAIAGESLRRCRPTTGINLPLVGAVQESAGHGGATGTTQTNNPAALFNGNFTGNDECHGNKEAQFHASFIAVTPSVPDRAAADVSPQDDGGDTWINRVLVALMVMPIFVYVIGFPVANQIGVQVKDSENVTHISYVAAGRDSQLRNSMVFSVRDRLR